MRCLPSPPAKAIDPARLLDEDALRARIAQGESPLKAFRETWRAAQEGIKALFMEGTPGTVLVPLRARLVDRMLILAFRRFFPGDPQDIALVAVGGYGRGELHPASDIDLLILLADRHQDHDERIQDYLAFLWDIKLDVGHSVRTLHQCLEAAELDITVTTNLMESRFLYGSLPLFRRLQKRIGPDRIWPSRRFFEAKLKEQEARHRHFGGTAYKLEPNIKEGPGGLRDIHMIGWVAKRHLGAKSLRDLVDFGFLTLQEYHILEQGEAFLWQIRCGLHHLSGRREDRLLFDYQKPLARCLGYHQEDLQAAVEAFMKDYYKTVKAISGLNEVLLQLFQEELLYRNVPADVIPLNRRFRIRKGFIEATSKDVFQRYPFALLELFLLLQQHEDIHGVRASTIRLIREHIHLIDESFRNDIRAKSLFMEIMRQPKELPRMHRYGVLGAYIPSFEAITGLMQHDLFHIYTVDEHTLFTVRNLCRLSDPAYAEELPLAREVMQRIPKPELLYLAGLFHDIAKGRGGDHSELGAQEAMAFCLHHGLSSYDAHLVAWLVRHHLMLSITAQRQDISDPEVIHAFAEKVGDQTHLDYLFLLTVADIRATNPNLWNSWRASLTHELYLATRHALRRGLERPIAKEERIQGTKTQALHRLTEQGFSEEAIRALWERLDENYFLRHAPDEIAWHTQAILQSPDLPLVLMRDTHKGTALFIYTRDDDHLFALTTAILTNLGLNIVDARIMTTRDGFTLDTYILLDGEGKPLHHPQRIQEALTALKHRLTPPYRFPTVSPRRPSRHIKHFPVPTRIEFHRDPKRPVTLMELFASDRPGLLLSVGEAFARCHVRLKSARISTLGARTEDVFFLTDRQNRPLEPKHQECLKRHILQFLEGERLTEQTA
ncbi:MAG: [protein-PII] uridylyltransferase [Gammaproteobacteria bacterium]|nr:MAG: [protein-PII] uridylyltransferase [Gammaproteobacteria bacterium]